jgi:hypothetical protein
MSKRTRELTKTVCPFPARRPVVENLEARQLMTVGPAALANGAANDAAFDAVSKTLHVVYYDTATKNLKYQGFNDHGTASTVETVDASPETGQYLSLALDRNTGALHVAYYDALNGDLKYARRDTSGVWSMKTIDSKNTVGLYPSIVLGDFNQPRISYYAKTTGDLKFAGTSDLGGTNWETSVIASANDVGRYSSIAVTPNGGFGFRLAVAYEDTTLGHFMYAEPASAGGLWAATTVDSSTQGGGGNISLVFDNGLPAMSYYDAKNADLKFAQRSSRGKWSTTLVAAKNSQGMYGDLAFTYNTDQPAIVYYNKTTDSALLTYRNLDGSWTFETLLTGGGRNLTAVDGVGANGQAPDLYLVWSDTATGGLKVGTF